MTERHKWADVIIAWANGQVIQFMNINKRYLGWHDQDFKTPPEVYNVSLEWRIKPRTIKIGDMEVPEPLRVAPEIGSMYFLVRATGFSSPHELEWRGNFDDYSWLSYGLIHTSRSGAIEHGLAIIQLSCGRV